MEPIKLSEWSLVIRREIRRGGDVHPPTQRSVRAPNTAETLI